jgi:hypothetical protein
VAPWAQISRAAARPRAVSRIGISSTERWGSPCRRSSAVIIQSAVRMSPALSALGSTMPSRPGTTTASMSEKANWVSSAFTRT